MRAFRPVVTIPLGIVTILACTLAVGVAAGQLPGEPVKSSGQSVTGAFEGWYENPDGSFTLLVGYFNRNTVQTFDIPVGPNNRIEPGMPDQGQPTHFLPRRQWGVFTIKVPKDFGKNKLTWIIVANGQTTTIPLHLDPLWIVAPFKDVGINNTPPTVKFSPDGAALQGPPSGFSATLTTPVSKPLPLSVWASDDGVRAPEAARRPARPVTVSWSKFRGPGDVTFDNPAPMVDEKTGTAAAAATFSAPGEYTLRLQANDATGDGGGGFQCCWTTAYVKVTVTP